MPKLALLSWSLYFAVAVAYRVVRQLRMTRRSGIVMPRPGAPFVQLLASGLFVSSLAMGCGAALVAWLAPDAAFFALAWAATPLQVGTGLALYAGGLCVTSLSQLAMGRAWRIGVEPSERTELVVHGPFRLVRNPIYSAVLLAVAGMTLLVPSPAALSAYALLFVALELQVRAVEEPHLVRTHGDAYRTYAARAGRFVPGLGRFERGQTA